MEESTNTVATLNKVMNSYNLLQMRLDTSSIINEAKLFLNAEIEGITQDTEGNLRREVISIGIPKANKKGISSILNWMQLICNPQVVQGNFPMDNKGHSEMYDMYIEECQVDLGDMLMINLYNYDIDEDEVQSIIDAMMNFIKAFMTRTIGNKERESYGETFKEVSSNVMKEQGGFKLFGKG